MLNGSSVKSQERFCRTLDVAINQLSELEMKTTSIGNLSIHDEQTDSTIQLTPNTQGAYFLIENIEQLGRSGARSLSIAIKFILPDRDGFCVRSDFLERRLDGCESVTRVQGFLEPRQEIKSASFDNENDTDLPRLSTLLLRAVGGIVVKDVDALNKVETELDNRISFPWISSVPLPTKRIVWVKGRLDFEFSRRIYEAAWALGTTLVIIDNPGHWLQEDNPRWTHLREAFIPVKISADEGFVDRIVSAVRNYGKPIDGIVTVSNALIIGVANACETLGLPTTPPEPYILAADKYKTREMELDQGGAFRVFSPKELRERLASKDHPPLQYPLIAKPCMGWGSECISKVHNEAELVQAVEKASDRHRTSPQQRTDVMIEPYIEGPEVDANIVLLDGEIVFFEIADDFPSPGDDAGNDWDASFQETAMLLPVGLPQNEIHVIRNSLHQSLLRQGFKHGIFHCEGRVRYSSMRYVTRNGREDLYPDERNEGKQPSFYLHEINARPAGYHVSVATHLTYGVDYYALHLLYSIGDMERYRALTQPFKNGPQWWLVLLIVPEEREGIMKSEDPGKELLERFEELRAAVPDYKTVQKKGNRLYGSKASTLSFLAYFSVVSRESREGALRLADKVRREFRYELE
jgi:ATP-grasp N-terminal domain/ATP-grasp domain